MKTLYSAILLFITTSCSTKLHYVGNTYPANKEVEIFVDQATIKKSFDIIGKGYIKQGIYSANYIKRIQPLALAKAKQKGADAVLIQDYDIPTAGTNVHSVFQMDSVGKNAITVGNTTVQQTRSQGFTILFLKYK